MSDERITILNDDPTENVHMVRPTSYGYAQADPNHKSHKRKHPLGFVPPVKQPKPKP